MANPVKVLFVGDAQGDVATLLRKIQAVHKKSGPFAAALVTGQLLSAEGGVTGDIATLPTPPLPVYFLGAGPQGVPEGLERDNLKYLGRSGVTTIAGLTIAFVDGCYDFGTYGPEDLAAGPSGTGPGGNTGARPGLKPGLCRYSRRDVADLHRALQKLEGEVDVLLTCEWPKGITEGLESSGATAAPPEGVDGHTGSAVIADVAMACRPRYHIAAGEEVSFARLPYANQDLGVGARVTRFVALGPIAGSAKSLHALALVPASELDPAQLSLKPEACTPSPLEAAVAAAALAKRKGEQDNALPNTADWRWQQPAQKKPRIQHVAIQHRPDVPRDPSATLVARNVPFAADEKQLLEWFGTAGTIADMFRGLNAEGRLNSWMIVQYANSSQAQAALRTLNGTQLLGREVTLELSHQKPQPPPGTGTGAKAGAAAALQASENCWFCLGSSAADVGLVVSVAEEAYLALDKGAISDTHVLAIPIDHAACSADLKPGAFAELERYLSALSSYYASRGLALVAFERFLALRKTGAGGNHCHINVIGVPAEAAKKGQAEFADALKAANLGEFEVLQMGEGAGATALHCALRGALSASGATPATSSSYPEYFQAILPGGVRLVRALNRQERLPLNLGREVLAGLAGDPGRADWKACTQSEEQRAEAAEAFKAAFAPYDPSAAA